MEDLLLCVNAIVPLILLMGLGYFLRRTKFLSNEGFSQLDKLCFRVLIPVMLFCNVYSIDLSEGLQVGAIVFMELSVMAVFLLTFFLVPRLLPNRSRETATAVHALCHGNLAVLGLPLILNLFGQEQMGIYSIMVACYSPLINPLMVFEHVYFSGDKPTAKQLFSNIFRSPFLIGTLAGMACLLLGIRFPASVQNALTSLRSVASPLCLIALGGSFSFVFVKSQRGIVAACVLAKCILIPAAVISIAAALGFRGIVLASLLIIFSCPSATATYSFCTGYCGDPPLASQLVVCSTVFSIASVFCWLMLCMRLGLI